MITKEGDSFKTWMSPQFKSFLVTKKIKAQDCWFLRDGDRAKIKAILNQGADYEKSHMLN